MVDSNLCGHHCSFSYPRSSLFCQKKKVREPVREKTNSLVSVSGPSKTELCSHRGWLEAGNFGFRKEMNCTIHVAKTKALISFAVTAKLICALVFAYANCWFSYA